MSDYFTVLENSLFHDAFFDVLWFLLLFQRYHASGVKEWANCVIWKELLYFFTLKLRDITTLHLYDDLTWYMTNLDFKNMPVPTCILQSRKVSYRNVSPWLSCNEQIARKTTTATTILLVENTAPSSVTTCFSLSRESFQMIIALGSKSTSFIMNDHCETTFLCRS